MSWPRLSLPRPSLRLLGSLGGAGALLGLGLLATRAPGCKGWDPQDPFTHLAPEVNEALGALDAGAPERAAELLEAYLGTGACTEGSLALPDRARKLPHASFDLGLALFALGERFGKPFGQEPPRPPKGPKGETAPLDPEEQQRDAQVRCALVLVEAIATDPQVPTELRARAAYLAGNLEFSRRGYEAAVKRYDQALALVPGLPEGEGVDGIGRDAAWNRSIAQRRLEEEKATQPPPEPPPEQPKEDPKPKDEDKKDPEQEQEKKDEPKPEPPKSESQDKEPPPPAPSASAAPGDQNPEGEPKPGEGPAEERQVPPEDRILDQLEEAPTYQEQEAKQRATGRRVRTMEDK